MFRWAALQIVGVVGAISTAAQPQPPPRPRPPVARAPAPPPRPATRPVEDSGLQGEAKLRWICKRLQLNEQQTQQMEALIAAFNAELAEGQKDRTEMMKKLQERSAEIQAAREQGNEDLVEKLRAELRELAPDVRAEKNFFEALVQVLTEPQKSRLPQVRELAKNPQSATLRPVHVLRAVRELGLTPDRDRRLEDVLDAFRKSLLVDRPKDEAAMEERTEQLVRDVRPILPPDQVAKFDEKLTEWRSNPPPARPVQMPEPAAAVPEPPKQP
jgi:hypothetical protein